MSGKAKMLEMMDLITKRPGVLVARVSAPLAAYLRTLTPVDLGQGIRVLGEEVWFATKAAWTMESVAAWMLGMAAEFAGVAAELAADDEDPFAEDEDEDEEDEEDEEEATDEEDEEEGDEDEEEGDEEDEDEEEATDDEDEPDEEDEEDDEEEDEDEETAAEDEDEEDEDEEEDEEEDEDEEEEDEDEKSTKNVVIVRFAANYFNIRSKNGRKRGVSAEDVLKIPKIGQKAGQNQRRVLNFTPRIVEGEPYTLDFIGSDEHVDRYGDIVRVKGWKLDNFKLNPVFLWAHNQYAPPVGKCLKVKKGKAPGGDDPALLFRVRFAADEEIKHDFAQLVYSLYKHKFLRASSVGFQPLKTVFVEDEDERAELGLGKWGVIYEKQDLWELSGCSIPANPFALQDDGIEMSADTWQAVEQATDRFAMYSLIGEDFTREQKNVLKDSIHLAIDLVTEQPMVERTVVDHEMKTRSAALVRDVERGYIDRNFYEDLLKTVKTVDSRSKRLEALLERAFNAGDLLRPVVADDSPFGDEDLQALVAGLEEVQRKLDG